MNTPRSKFANVTPKRGTASGMHKLNDELVRRIRRQHARKEAIKKKLDAAYGTEAFAVRYKVHPNTITKVLTYATWKHVLEETGK